MNPAAFAEGGESAPRGQRLARLRRAWAPRGARRVVSSLRSDSRPAHRTVTHSQHAVLLREQWAGVFTAQSWDAEVAAAVLRHTVAFDWTLYFPPSRADVQSVMGPLADSAPGPDGVQYSAWRAGGPDAVDAIYALVQSMSDGENQEGLHDALYVFLPKAPCAVDGSVHAEETRPLALKDTGINTPTVVMSRGVAPVIAANATHSQRGFLAGRNFVDNLWELDAELRRRSVAAEDGAERLEATPMLLSLDIKTAFPRVSQR